MTDTTLLTAVVGTALALMGTGATFLACKAFYGRRMGELAARMDKLERARTQTNGMLVQAKKQIEALQKDLEDARRASRQAAAKPERDPKDRAAAKEAEKAKALADARARLDQLLDAPASTLGTGGWADSGTARGFAETQPLSGFGPTQVPPAPQRHAA